MSGGGETNLSNDTASDTVTINFTSDLTISLTHGGGNLTQGQTGVVYTSVASNVGGAATSGTVTVVSALPAGLTATAISGTGWTCTLATLTCTRSDTLAPGAAYPPINITANVAQNATGPLVATATVSGGGEVNLANDVATDSALVAGPPDMTISLTHGGGNVTQGQTGVVYTATASNVGATAASGAVTVANALPAGLTATAISGTGWTCTLAALTCTRSDTLAPGAAYPPINITANVAQNATGPLVATATVSGGGEVNLGNDVATDSALPGGPPDMTISLTHGGGSFAQGQEGVNYTIIASNVGLTPASGTVTVVDALPAGLTATAISGAGWTCTLATLTCTRSETLAAGAAYPPITVTVNVAPNAAGPLTNVAAVNGGGETNFANDVASDPAPLTLVPDMTVTITAGGGLTPGQVGATYAITASNVGGAATSGVVSVTDILPAGLTATAISGAGWTCDLASLTCTRSDSLSPGGTYPPITVTVNVSSSASGTLVNSGLVKGGGETYLPNDTAQVPVVVSGAPDLTIAKTHTGSFTRGQQTAAYTLTVSNIGNAPTSSPVTVSDNLPAGLTAAGIAGSGWTCVTGSLTCSRSDVLAAGASYPPITVTVSVAADAPATVVNRATVAGGGETNTGNDTATDSTSVTGAPGLSLSKTHTGDFTRGANGSFLLTATNGGSAPIAGAVTLTDTLPAGMAAVSISGTGWNCALATLSCTRGDGLAAGASFPPVTVTVSVAQNAPADLLNTAVIAGTGLAGAALSANASDSVHLSGIDPALQITKAVDRSFAEAGDVVTYVVTVKNASPGTLTNASVRDQLPNGFQYVPGTAQLALGLGSPSPINPSVAPPVLVFAIGTMAPAQAATITYRVRITPAASPGQSANLAVSNANGPTGLPVQSAVASATVRVGSGLLTLDQFIIGRVFEDVKGTGVYALGDRPAAGYA